MKFIGIIWNSAEDKYKDILSDIKEYGNIDAIYSIDFKDDFEKLIKKLYPFEPDELWKAEYKIDGLINQYDNNVIHIVVLNMPETEKVYLPQKNKNMYLNVLHMKVDIRHKYKHLVKENKFHRAEGVSYDNVYHMTDDFNEYVDNLEALLPFLIKHNPNNNIFNIDALVDENNIKYESNGTRKTFWLTPKILFKEETEGTYESYSELFNMHLMKLLGLNNSCYYGLVKYKSKNGVITKHMAKNDENIFLGNDIFNYYGIYDQKELIYYNSLNLLPIILKQFCYEKGLIYDESITKEFEKLFMYDLITMQADRNPSNWALVYNENTKHTHLSYFDNSNMMFFDNKDAIEAFRKGQLDLPNYINNNITTFLIADSSDIELCYSSKILHIHKFLKNANEEQKKMFFDMLNLINNNTINSINKKIEVENHCILPNEFKIALIKAFDFQKWQIYNLNEKIQLNERKVLCKKK